jgi:hypothetical protein
MERDQLEHVIRAASAITQETEFVIVGSQSILGAFPDAPESLLQSNELDIYPRVNWERLSDLSTARSARGRLSTRPTATMHRALIPAPRCCP